MSVLDRLTEDDLYMIHDAMADVARTLLTPVYDAVSQAEGFSAEECKNIRDEVHRFRVNLESAIALLEVAGCRGDKPTDSDNRCPKAEAIDFFRERLDRSDKASPNEHPL